MADGILGLGSGGSAGLNQELIDKLKEAEGAATVKPIENRLDNIIKEDGERDTLQNIINQVNQFLETIKPFDLYISEGVNAFDQKVANVTGSSAVFDAVDVAQISEGTTEVFIEQLAKRDVFQTNSFADKTEQILGGDDPGDMITLSQPGKPIYQSDVRVSSDDLVDATGGNITINVDGVDKTFTVNADTTYNDLIKEINLDETLDAKLTNEGRLSISHKDRETDITITENLNTEVLGISLGEKYSTEGISYEQLAKNINANSSYSANIEKVGANENRLVIKSTESGLDNAISITQTGVDLGLNEVANHTVTAQNLKATVDGISYDVSSNVIVVDGGLKITAVEENAPGEFSAISIEKDVSTVEPLLQNFVNEYNNLMTAIDNELYSADSTIEDKSTLRSIVEGIKGQIFGTYGDEKLSVFNMGFEVDKNGTLSLDSTAFNEAIEDNIDTLKDLFIGVAEDPGLGTSLKEYVDALDSFNGFLTKYEENMNSRKEALEKEKDKAQESLDNKYSQLAQQFASYTAIISQFEAQFSGLKLMIEQSTAS